jgi:sulfate transport system permease protein
LAAGVYIAKDSFVAANRIIPLLCYDLRRPYYGTHWFASPQGIVAFMSVNNRRILPGFGASLSVSVAYLSVLVLIPLMVCFWKASTLTNSEFWATVLSRQARSAYWVSISTSFVAAVVDVFIGTLVAWVLVRYEFPGKKLMDSLVDLPFALPTAVAGLVYSSLYAHNGWLGRFLYPLGIDTSYNTLSMILVLSFIGLPFVVRALQPVLESFDADVEEAAASLGANRRQIFCRVILPGLMPAIWTGFALTFARGLGEYGSIVFVANMKPFKTEIAPFLIVKQLEQFNYDKAAAIAVVMLFISFSLLVVINYLEWRSRAHAR